MQAEEILTPKEMELVDALDPFEMEDDQFLAVFDLMQERDDLIQQMLDWIEANPEADTDDLLNKAVDIQQRDAGFR